MKKIIYILTLIFSICFAGLLDSEDQILNSSIALAQNPAALTLRDRSFLNLGCTFSSFHQQNSKILDGGAFSGTDLQTTAPGSYYFSAGKNIFERFWLGIKYSFNSLNMYSIRYKNDLNKDLEYDYKYYQDNQKTSLLLGWEPGQNFSLGMAVENNYYVIHTDNIYGKSLQELLLIKSAEKSYTQAKPYYSLVLGLVNKFNDLFTVSFAQKFSEKVQLHNYDDSDGSRSDNSEPLPNVSALGLIFQPNSNIGFAATVESVWQLVYETDYSTTTNHTQIRKLPYNIYGLACTIKINDSAELEIMGNRCYHYQWSKNEDTGVVNYGWLASSAGFNFSYLLAKDEKILLGIYNYSLVQENPDTNTDIDIIKNTRGYLAYTYYFETINRTETIAIQEQPTSINQAVMLEPKPITPTKNIRVETPETADSTIVYKLSAEQVKRGEAFTLHVVFKNNQNVEGGTVALGEGRNVEFNKLSSWFYTAEITIPQDYSAGAAVLKINFLVNGRNVAKQMLIDVF